MTYQELHSYSSINKNVLRKRLDSLVKSGFVARHRYSLPYQRYFYGYTHRHNLCPAPPTARIYYLVNVYEEEALSHAEKIYKKCFRLPNKTGLELMKKEAQELDIDRLKSEILDNPKINKLDKFILGCNWEKKNSLFRLRWHIEIKSNFEERGKEPAISFLLQYANYILDSGLFSIFDIIIKCCHSPTVFIEGGTFNEYTTPFLPIESYLYSDIMNILMETKYENKIYEKFYPKERKQ